ncbi:hypothetical protein AT15_09455 [Kosmotoga arenicorallina S304]|uniref:DUF2344 domain-containing protein n=1 Tax=Kosmotoga arenicorallina S304 TaxID=1453497 RepID=A0A176K1Y2_9BACT|nr:TIGR03936 family radical SAM-associated protein [Kosmotoga arenicorallina]OAA30899.1 hypothetical protein AT15_09455 [Kosmotoga arenicorallina S304]
MAEYILRFGRGGLLRFLSQQETSTAIERMLRRAKIPVAYSQGFHPHPKISYSPAVPTGVASSALYLKLTTFEEDNNIFEKIKRHSVFTLRILGVWKITEGFDLQELVEKYHYFLYLPKKGFNPNKFSPDIPVQKHGRKKIKTFKANETYEGFEFSEMNDYFVVKYFQPVSKQVSYQELLKILSISNEVSENYVYVYVRDAVFQGKYLSEILNNIGGKENVRS